MRAKENEKTHWVNCRVSFHSLSVAAQIKRRAVATLISSTENGEIVKVVMEIKIHQHHDWLFILLSP